MAESFKIRLDEETKARWKASADAMGVSLAEWVRRRCDGPEEPDEEPEPSLREIISECPPEQREDVMQLVVDNIRQADFPTAAKLISATKFEVAASKDFVLKMPPKKCFGCARKIRVGDGYLVNADCEDCGGG